MRLCQHPNNASIIVTFSSTFCETRVSFPWFNRLHGTTVLACRASAHSTPVTYLVPLNPDSFHGLPILPGKDCCSQVSPDRTQVAVGFCLRMFKKSKEPKGRVSDNRTFMRAKRRE